MSWSQGSSPPPPGWYPDPAGTGRQRWWDGTRWTAHYASDPRFGPQAAPPVVFAPSPRAPRPPPVFWAMPVAALVMFVGSVAPWVTIEYSDFGQSFNRSFDGVEEGGALTLLATITSAVVLTIWVFERVVLLPVVAAAIGAAGALFALYRALNPATPIELPAIEGFEVSAAWGPWVAFAGGLAMCAVAVVLALTTRSRSPERALGSRT